MEYQKGDRVKILAGNYIGAVGWVTAYAMRQMEVELDHMGGFRLLIDPKYVRRQ